MPYFRCFLLAALTLTLFGCSSETAPPPQPAIKPVKTVTVGEREAGALRSFPGTVVAGDAVDLGFRVPGQLAALPVLEGQHVERNDVLARLDQRDFLTTVANLESQLTGAKATLHEATLNLERSEQLLRSDIIARAAYDSAKAAHDNARARLESLEQQIRQARLNLQYTELTAPFAGTVAAKYIKNFENVQAQQPIIRLEDTSTLDVEVEIPEFVYALYSKSGTRPVSPMVRFEAFPDKEFPARLKEYRTTLNPRTQTYTVTLTVDKLGEVTLQTGMTAEVQGRLPVADQSEGFMLPATAVFGGTQGETLVWIVGDDFSVHSRRVDVGEMQNSDMVIRTGLEAGEKVVTAGVHYLREGQVIRLLEGPVGGDRP